LVRDVTALVARGPDRIETLEFETVRGIEILQTDLLVLDQGLVPEVNFGNALGCAYRWNDAQACFEPVVDAWGGSTLAGVFFAGDAAGIAGAAAAQARGQLAALAAANALGRIDAKARDAAAEGPRAAPRRALRDETVSGPLLRPDRHRTRCSRARDFAGRRGLLPAALAREADRPRAACSTADLGGG
jgi:hypothetical protein